MGDGTIQNGACLDQLGAPNIPGRILSLHAAASARKALAEVLDMERLSFFPSLLALVAGIFFPTSSHAQEVSVPKSRTMPPSAASRDATMSDDPAALRRYNAYRDAYVKSLPFAEVAETSGIRVQTEEVAARMAAYAELYPGKSFDLTRVESQLKAEKYLAAHGFTVSGGEVEERLSAFKAAGISLKKGQEEAGRKALQGEILFSEEKVLRLREKTLELTTLRNQEIMEPSTTQWPQESVRLQGLPEECLASFQGECWATLGEFNAVLGESRVPRVVDLDSVRAAILRDYLFEKQLARMEPSPGKGPLADSILESMKTEKSRLELFSLAHGMGRQVQDPKVLWETYDRYYRDLFKARMEAVVEVIGSSDSAYMDSLHHVLLQWKQAGRNSQGIPPGEPELPWLAFKEERLPRDLSVHTDTLNPGEFTKPIKTVLGFYLVKVREIRRRKEVSFHDAHPRLVFLATRDKFLRMDSVIDAKSLKYYQKHADEFRIPDTLGLTAWLVPFPPEAKKGKPSALHLPPHVVKDTLEFSPIQVSSLLLPRKLQTRLSALIREKAPKRGKEPGKRFCGPLPGEYGQWYFRIDKVRKADGILPYAKVKQEIIRRLANPETKPEALARDSTRDEVLFTLGLAEFHKSKQLSKLQSLSDVEIERMIAAGEVDTTKIPKGMTMANEPDLYRQSLGGELYSKIVSEHMERVKRIEIDYTRLFKR